MLSARLVRAGWGRPESPAAPEGLAGKAMSTHIAAVRAARAIDRVGLDMITSVVGDRVPPMSDGSAQLPPAQSTGLEPSVSGQRVGTDASNYWRKCFSPGLSSAMPRGGN